MPPQVIDRSSFIQRWCDRAPANDDPFDEFFSLWIALVICARPLLQPLDFDRIDTDRRAVLKLSAAFSESMFREIDSCQDDLNWLAKRKGTHRGDPIVDVHDFKRAPGLRNLFHVLAAHYSGGNKAKPGRVVEAVVELLNHVRNNLFHGVKDPDDIDDRELLTRLNSLLRAILRAGRCC